MSGTDDDEIDLFVSEELIKEFYLENPQEKEECKQSIVTKLSSKAIVVLPKVAGRQPDTWCTPSSSRQQQAPTRESICFHNNTKMSRNILFTNNFVLSQFGDKVQRITRKEKEVPKVPLVECYPSPAQIYSNSRALELLKSERQKRLAAEAKLAVCQVRLQDEFQYMPGTFSTKALTADSGYKVSASLANLPSFCKIKTPKVHHLESQQTEQQKKCEMPQSNPNTILVQVQDKLPTMPEVSFLNANQATVLQISKTKRTSSVVTQAKQTKHWEILLKHPPTVQTHKLSKLLQTTSTTCSVCLKTYATARSLSKHKSTVHKNGGKKECPKCKKNISRNNFAQHRAICCKQCV